MSDRATEPGMAKEKIELPDGRYLIYYTFTDTTPADPACASTFADTAIAEGTNGDGPSPA